MKTWEYDQTWLTRIRSCVEIIEKINENCEVNNDLSGISIGICKVLQITGCTSLSLKINANFETFNISNVSEHAYWHKSAEISV